MTHLVEYHGTFGGEDIKAEMYQNGQHIHFTVYWGGILVDDCTASSDCWDWKNLHGAALVSLEKKQLRNYAENQCFSFLESSLEELGAMNG